MKKSISILASLVAAVSIGCSGWSENTTRHYNIYVSPEFSDDQASQIMAAAVQWQTESKNFITFSGTTSENDPDTITVYAASNSWQLHKDCESNDVLGCEESGGVDSKIYLPADGSLGANFQWVAAHEIGHSLGAMHISGGNLMCWSIGCSKPTIQCGDLVELSRAWDHSFDPYSLPACQ